MKATIERPKRSVLAGLHVEVGLVDEQVNAARVDTPYPNLSRRPPNLRRTAALMAAAAVLAGAVALLVWSMVGDSGAHLVESAPVTPSTTQPDPDRGTGAAQRAADRKALVVDVDRDGRPGTSVDRTGPDGGFPADTMVSSSATSSSLMTTTSLTSSATSPSSTSNSRSVPASSATSPKDLAPSDSAGAAPARPGGTDTTVRAGTASLTAAPTRPTTVTSTAAPSTASTTSDVSVAWEEQFSSLDAGRWAVEHSTYGDGNGEQQCYRPENVRVANGRLTITAKSETYTCPNGATRRVTSGMVRSRGLTFSPGQAIEFRVRLTPPDPGNQAGLWPAVWASSWAGSWPRGGELDFLEVMTAEDPRRAVFSMHYADRSGGHELQNKAVPMSSYFSDGWHTIRFHYGHNGRLDWYMDGSNVHSVSAADTIQGYPAPFDRTITEIKINLAIGGTPGPLASGALGSSGATFEVDYVKVFNL